MNFVKFNEMSQEIIPFILELPEQDTKYCFMHLYHKLFALNLIDEKNPQQVQTRKEQLHIFALKLANNPITPEFRKVMIDNLAGYSYYQGFTEKLRGELQGGILDFHIKVDDKEINSLIEKKLKIK